MRRAWIGVLAAWMGVACGGNGDGSGGSPDGGPRDAGGDGAVLRDGEVPDGSAGATRFLPAFAPGTRLEVRAFGTGGEAALLRAFYDTELELECNFDRAADGTIRCLPPWSSDSVATYYLDAECTDPVYAPTRADCEDPEYLVVRGDERTRGCALRPRHEVIRLAATEVPSGTVYQRIPDGSCGEAPFDSPRAFAGTPVAPDAFVEAELVAQGEPDGLGVWVLVAEDGARQLFQAYDNRHGVGCSSQTLEESQRCMPTPNKRVDVFWFADSTCSEPLAWGVFTPPSCAPTPVARASSSFADELGELVHLGPPLTEGSAFRRAGETCEEYPVDEQAWTLQPITGPASAEDLFPMTQRAYGAASLPTYFDAAEDGTLLAPIGAWDPIREVHCEPRKVDGGSFVCLPRNLAFVDDYFADPGCTEQPLAVTTESQPRPSVAITEEFDFCDRAPHLATAYAVGDEWTGAGPVYRGTAEACAAEDRSEGALYYRRGPSVLDELIPLEDVVLRSE